jgi:predicted DNA-binding transcriptional regulator AlpA
MFPSPAMHAGIWEKPSVFGNEQGRPSAPAYNPNDLLDEKEAAHFLKMAAATLRNWRVTKQGPAVLRVGKRAIRYRFSDLEAFIAASSAEVA